MNNRGILRFFTVLFLILLLLLIYFYTEPVKEIVGMVVDAWEPISFDDSNKTVTLKLANASELAHQVVLEDADSSDSDSGDDSEDDDSPKPSDFLK